VVIVPVPIFGAIKNVPSIPGCRSKDKSPFGPHVAALVATDYSING
jgi:hypothetical protein